MTLKTWRMARYVPGGFPDHEDRAGACDCAEAELRSDARSDHLEEATSALRALREVSFPLAERAIA